VKVESLTVVVGIKRVACCNEKSAKKLHRVKRVLRKSPLEEAAVN